MKSSDTGAQTPKFVIIESQARGLVDQNRITYENRPSGSGTVTKKPDFDHPSSLDVEPEQPTLELKALRKNGIIYPGMQEIDVLNAFRSLRMTLQSKMKAFNSVILVSSLAGNDDSAFTAVNLATAFTFEQKRQALVVDCNFSKPSFDEILIDAPKHGLYDFLTGANTDLENLVHPTLIPRMSLVPASNMKYSDRELVEVFTDERIKNLVELFKSRNSDRVIILNTPPILDSVDTKALAKISDYIIVAFKSADGTPTLINRTINEFGKEKVTGFIMVK